MSTRRPTSATNDVDAGTAATNTSTLADPGPSTCQVALSGASAASKTILCSAFDAAQGGSAVTDGSFQCTGLALQIDAGNQGTEGSVNPRISSVIISLHDGTSQTVTTDVALTGEDMKFVFGGQGNLFGFTAAQLTKANLEGANFTVKVKLAINSGTETLYLFRVRVLVYAEEIEDFKTP